MSMSESLGPLRLFCRHFLVLLNFMLLKGRCCKKFVGLLKGYVVFFFLSNDSKQADVFCDILATYNTFMVKALLLVDVYQGRIYQKN